MNTAPTTTTLDSVRGVEYRRRRVDCSERPTRFKVIVPDGRQGLFDWFANDERAFAHAERVADHTAEHFPAQRWGLARERRT